LQLNTPNNNTFWVIRPLYYRCSIARRGSAFLRKKTWLKSGGGQLDIWKQLSKDRGKHTAIDFEG
jgi:hypothetical protein